jgi:hypothetical protein
MPRAGTKSLKTNSPNIFFVFYFNSEFIKCVNSSPNICILLIVIYFFHFFDFLVKKFQLTLENNEFENYQSPAPNPAKMVGVVGARPRQPRPRKF